MMPSQSLGSNHSGQFQKNNQRTGKPACRCSISMPKFRTDRASNRRAASAAPPTASSKNLHCVCVFWQREVLTTRQFQSAGESKALDVLAKEGLAHESPGSGFLSAPRRTLESAHPATSSKRYRRCRRHGHLQQPARPFHGAHQLAVSTAKATLPGSAARKAL